jgi:hypothetical protein
MASGMTNKGRYRILELLKGGTLPTNFYVALVTDTPDEDTNTMSDLTEIAAGNGYTSGGYQLTPNGTDFPTLTEDDTNDLARLTTKTISWTASGGSIPASGSGALFAVFTDDNGTVASREIWAWHDLSGPLSVSDTQSLTITSISLTLSDAAL